MSAASEQEENYHHGNDLPDTSTPTSALTHGRSGAGGWVAGKGHRRICLFPRQPVTTQRELRIHTDTHRHAYAKENSTRKALQEQIRIMYTKTHIGPHNTNNTHTPWELLVEHIG